MSFFYKIVSRYYIKKLTSNFQGNLIIRFPDKSKYIIGDNKNSPFLHITNNFFSFESSF